MNATQAKILACMSINGLTVKECSNHCGTTELRTNISRLKKEGYEFSYEWEEHDGGRHKRYFLRGEPNARSVDDMRYISAAPVHTDDSYSVSV